MSVSGTLQSSSVFQQDPTAAANGSKLKRGQDLLPQAPVAPPEGYEHQDKTANHELFHDRPFLVSWLDAVLLSLLLGGFRYKRQQAADLSLYYTLLEAKDLDHILTILGRILTGMLRIGRRGKRICLCYNSSET